MRVDVLICKIMAFVLLTIGIAFTFSVGLFVEAINRTNILGFIIVSCIGLVLVYAGSKLSEW